MSRFKNIDENIFKLLYTDTDSLHIIIYDRKKFDELFPNLIGSDLGQFKIEKKLKEGIYLSPKVYGGITEHGQEFSKIKGYKNKISFEELKSLLVKDCTLEIKQELWFKKLKEGNITLKDQIYTLQTTDSKRQLIYVNNKHKVNVISADCLC
jgi:hypothetical protein